MQRFRTIRSLVAMASVVATLSALVATPASARGAERETGPVPASFFYDDGQYAVFGGPPFDVENGCPPADDPDATLITRGNGRVLQIGGRATDVRIYELADYAEYADAFPGVPPPLAVLLAICVSGAPDAPVMTGSGRTWFVNDCDPGPEGCQEPGSSWRARNGLLATVRDAADGEVRRVRTYARVNVAISSDGETTEDLVRQRVVIR